MNLKLNTVCLHEINDSNVTNHCFVKLYDSMNHVKDNQVFCPLKKSAI